MCSVNIEHLHFKSKICQSVTCKKDRDNLISKEYRARFKKSGKKKPKAVKVVNVLIRYERDCPYCNKSLYHLDGRHTYCGSMLCKKARSKVYVTSHKKKNKDKKVKKTQVTFETQEPDFVYEYESFLTTADRKIIKSCRKAYKEAGLTEEQIKAIYMECL